MAKTAAKGKPKKPVAKPKKETRDTAGAPPKYETVEILQAAIDKYFKYIEGIFTIETDEDTGQPKKIWERYPEPATITGLAYWLGFDSRQSIYDYKGRAGFSYTIKRARLRIEANYEKNLSGQQPAGSIFALKNLGWNDKVQNEISGPNGKPVENNHALKIVINSTAAGISSTEKEIQQRVNEELGIDENE